MPFAANYGLRTRTLIISGKSIVDGNGRIAGGLLVVGSRFYRSATHLYGVRIWVSIHILACLHVLEKISNGYDCHCIRFYANVLKRPLC